eukprot:PITA_19196
MINADAHGMGMNRRELDTTGIFESVCSETLYPDVCVSSFLAHPEAAKAATSKELARIAVKVTLEELKTLAAALPSEMGRRSPGRNNRSAVEDCMELLGYSFRQLNDSLTSIQKSQWRKKEAEDVQTWLSASLTNQETCIERLKGPNSEDPLVLDGALQKVSKLLSNSLAVMNSIATVGDQRVSSLSAGNGRRLLNDPSHASELYSVRNGLPSWLSPADRRLLHGRITADAIVAQDGSGNYETVMEAVNAAPSKSKGRHVIHVKAGIYEEKVTVSKEGIVLVGDGKSVTVVRGSSSGSSLKSDANFIAAGNRFIAVDMGFQNTAGPLKGQAVALMVASDQSALYRCGIEGYQDTLYAHSQRQFYRECDIYGSVDFIFGNAAAVFQSCNILARKGKGSKSFISAHSRMDPHQKTGFSFQNCRVTAADNNPVPTYLGRPWKQYSRTVYMHSYLETIIAPQGWYHWKGSFALDTLYYGEYMNFGPGAATANRVTWPGYHVIASPTVASQFTAAEFISGNSWLPSTGIPFHSNWLV